MPKVNRHCLYRQKQLAPRWLNLAPRRLNLAPRLLYTAPRRKSLMYSSLAQMVSASDQQPRGCGFDAHCGKMGYITLLELFVILPNKSITIQELLIAATITDTAKKSHVSYHYSFGCNQSMSLTDYHNMKAIY